LLGKDLKLTFEQYANLQESIVFKGEELIAIFLALVDQEDHLDRLQQGVLERLRGSLYENLSVEQMENLVAAYSTRFSKTR
jgi:hypothetical protein